MVYIGRDGQVLDRRPWSLNRLIEIIIGFFALFSYFFRTMLSPLFDSQNDFRSSRGGGGGGSGGNRPGSGMGAGPGPNRRIGRITHAPECPGGGCSRSQ